MATDDLLEIAWERGLCCETYILVFGAITGKAVGITVTVGDPGNS